MKTGIAPGFGQKQKLVIQLREARNEAEDYGLHQYATDDDYPDIILPLARSIAKGVDREIAACGSGAGVSIAANKIAGVWATLITESYSAPQGVEHNDMNLLCVGGRVIGPMLQWELVQAFLKVRYLGEERFQRRLNKVIALEKEGR